MHPQLIVGEAVSVRAGIAGKRLHDRGNSYKGNQLIGTGLKFQRVGPSSSCPERGGTQADVQADWCWRSI